MYKSRKEILNSPAGINKEADCAKGLPPCVYNKYNYCIVCGNIKGHKAHRQKKITLNYKKSNEKT